MLSSQCYVEVLPNPAVMTGFADRGIPLLPRPGERRCWLPVGALLSTEEQREWRFLLECWCLYNGLAMRPHRRPVPLLAREDAAVSGARSLGVEVALTPAQILDFLDWVGAVSRHEKPGDSLAASSMARLRAFLADDMDAAAEIRIIAADA
jgi:hypothetical protein